jgi:hypothetical protein
LILEKKCGSEVPISRAVVASSRVAEIDVMTSFRIGVGVEFSLVGSSDSIPSQELQFSIPLGHITPNEGPCIANSQLAQLAQFPSPNINSTPAELTLKPFLGE